MPVLRPLVLSGGPAVGKTTCGRALARERGRAAYIDADDVRQLVVAGEATLWSGPERVLRLALGAAPEGEAQHALAAHSIAAMATNLLAAGFEVVVADFVTARTLAILRAELAGCFVVHLGISLSGARERAGTRRVLLTKDEFELLHRMAAAPLDADLLLEVDGLRFDAQLDAIRSAWLAASRSRPSGDMDAPRQTC